MLPRAYLPVEILLEISYHINDSTVIDFYEVLGLDVKEELIRNLINRYNLNYEQIEFMKKNYFITDNYYEDYLRYKTDKGDYNELSHRYVDLVDILRYKAKIRDFEYLQTYKDIKDPIHTDYNFEFYNDIIAEELHGNDDDFKKLGIENASVHSQYVIIGLVGKDIETYIQNKDNNILSILSGVCQAGNIQAFDEIAKVQEIDVEQCIHGAIWNDNIDMYKHIINKYPKYKQGKDLELCISYSSIKILECVLLTKKVRIKNIVQAIRRKNLFILNMLLKRCIIEDKQKLFDKVHLQTNSSCEDIMDIYTYRYIFDDIINVDLNYTLDVNIIKYLYENKRFDMDEVRFYIIEFKTLVDIHDCAGEFPRTIQIRLEESINFLNLINQG